MGRGFMTTTREGGKGEGGKGRERGSRTPNPRSGKLPELEREKDKSFTPIVV